MANTIKIKRRPASGAAGKPSSLLNGELAFNENDNILYYGHGSGVGGAASTIEQIGGSGYFAHRSGINASGLWPISVTGNAGSVTDGVYTTGTQTINGLKTFGNTTTFNSGISAVAINTSSNSVGYFAVFDNNPNSSTQTLKSVSKSDVLDDIGGASSGIDMTAGSGLVGGGNLTASRTFNVGQGDGISVSADSIAVDSTVVRTTGNQNINGVKSLYDSTNNYVLFSNADDVIKVKAPNTGDTTYYFVGLNGGGSPPSSNDADRSLVSRSTSQVKSDLSLDNVENLALSGITFTAGSGLAGGGTLAANRTFDINTGDGIQIVSDAVAVNNTVVRTTGVQSVDGIKTFGNISIFNSGILASGTTSIRSAATASTATQFAVFTSSPASSSQSILTRTPSEVKTDIGLSNVTNDAQVKKLASTSGGFVPTWNGTTGDALNIGYSVETTLTGGTGALPRADAVKTYVDNMIVSGIATNDAMIFKGAIDCSTNPNYPAADRGWVYKISVAGKIGGASGPVVEVNDTIICGTDGTAAGTHADVGSNWNILQTNIVDASILVTGPASATSGNFAMFDGTTGKIVKDSSLSSSSFATAGHVHGNITNAGAIGSTANLPIITTTAGALTTGSFGSTANTFCQGNDSRLSDTRNTTNSITVNNGGAGDSSSFTFNGSAARTISYNSVGAPSISGANATGTWNISVTGNAATVTNGVYTTGTQTIGGSKTFSSSVIFNANNAISIQHTGVNTASSLNITRSGDNYFSLYTGEQSSASGYLLFGLQTDTSFAPFRIALDTDGGNAYITNGTWRASTIEVNRGGTGQTSYTNGQLLIGNTTGNTLTKATLTEGTGIDIANGNGSITITHEDTSTLTGAQGSNGIASITVDGLGHVTAVTTATYLTAGTVCAAIVDCTLDGGSF
jgi:hypothetical protein